MGHLAKAILATLLAEVRLCDDVVDDHFFATVNKSVNGLHHLASLNFVDAHMNFL